MVTSMMNLSVNGTMPMVGIILPHTKRPLSLSCVELCYAIRNISRKFSEF